MSHYGVTPASVVTALVAGLSALKRIAGPPPSGCLRTLQRYAGDRYDLEAIDLRLAAGTPAMLVAYLGGPIEPGATDGRLFYHRMKFSVICAAGSYASAEERLAGGSPATDPGVEDLLDWASYYACRAAMAVSGLTRVKPTDHKWLRIAPTKFLAAAELEATRQLDLWDDDGLGEELERIGLVHSPLDPEELFEDDNLTPKQEEPLVGGGVATLE
jgi:hypothetical protein